MNLDYKEFKEEDKFIFIFTRLYINKPKYT